MKAFGKSSFIQTIALKGQTNPVERSLGSTAVAVRVGKGYPQQTFHIHQNLLQNRAKFFSKPPAYGTFNINKFTPEIFGAYVQLIYTGRIARKDAAKEPTDPEDGFSAELLTYLHLYFACTFLGDTKAQNACITALVETFNQANDLFNPARSPDFMQHVKLVYEKSTNPKATVRRLLVAMVLTKPNADYFEKNYGKFPKDFTKEVSLNSLREGGKGAGGKLDPKDF